MNNIYTFHKNISKDFLKKQMVLNFEIVKYIKFIPKFTIVVCVFRMDDPYKDESIYIKGIDGMIRQLPEYYKNFSLRIYYDDSVMMKDNKYVDVFKNAMKCEHVELIKYDFPQFKKKVHFII
jgi:hypothetical protein